MAFSIGSDAEFDLTCTPCGEDNIREEAKSKYSLECEYLCQGMGHHARLKATRSLQQVDKHEAVHAPFFATATKCRYHPDRHIEIYCETHDMVYCLKCIVIEHRGTCNVKSIDDIVFSSSQGDELQTLQNELNETKAILTIMKEGKERNVELVEKQKNDSITIVQEIEHKLLKHIHKLRLDTTDAIQKKSAEIENQLQFDIRSIADSITEVEKMSNQLEGEKVLNAEQEFIQIKLGKKIIEDSKSLNKDMRPHTSNAKGLYLRENKDLCASVMMAVSLGNVTTKKKNLKLKTNEIHERG